MSRETDSMTSRPSGLLAYLQLVRLPNVFTAVADVAMGFLVTHASIEPTAGPVLGLLVLASSGLYLGGMVLNDLRDVDVDRVERPFRPLPSGRVSIAAAKRLNWTLFVLGAIGAAGASLLTGDARPIVVAVALIVAIGAYDAALKSTVFGPLSMGTCRLLNILLGMSVAPQSWESGHWMIAGGIGIYVAGITWFARGEASTSQRWQLLAGMLVMLAGIAALWRYPAMMPPEQLAPMVRQNPTNWNILWALIALIIGRRAVQAIANPQPALVQAAVKTGILSIIVLDAVVVLAVHGPVLAAAILLLLLPTLLLGWWVYST